MPVLTVLICCRWMLPRRSVSLSRLPNGMSSRRRRRRRPPWLAWPPGAQSRNLHTNSIPLGQFPKITAIRGKRIFSLGKLGTTWTGLAGAQELSKREPRSALAVSNASRRRRRYLGYQFAWIRVRKANNPKGEKKVSR